MTVAEEPDALLAVVAHGLIDAAYPALMAGHTLQRHDLPAELREELVEIVVDKTRVVVDRLQELMQDVPPELFKACCESGTSLPPALRITASGRAP